jgi:SAM-dependent methyltransferase
VPFDLDLFLELNREYESKPLVPAPPLYTSDALETRGSKRADRIMRRAKRPGARVLEIGCGMAETIGALAREHGCTGVGVDVERHPEWDAVPEGVELQLRDITYDASDLGQFDLIVSYSAWEHLRHPFAMLKQARALLKPDGMALIYANLYRGPKASHRYREVYFPWPHLLFSDDVFEAFYRHIGMEPDRAEWVSQLSIADYRRYFELAGLKLTREEFSITPIDEAFYARFADVLERFPRYDLERDFIWAELEPDTPPRPNRLIREFRRWRGKLRQRLPV